MPFQKSFSFVSLRAIICLTLALSLLPGCDTGETLRGTILPEMPLVNFTLTDQNGEPFTLTDQKGKVVLLFFGFTYCPDVCPMTLATWKRVQDALGPDAENVRFVYITVDPERDTPEKLKNHLAVFSADFIGLTGTPAQLDSVYNGYGVIREKVTISESAAGYLVNHTASMYFLDRNGIWRSKMSNDAKVKDIVHDVRVLLKS